MATVKPIRAAGGLVWRPDGERRLVCLVHRPRYDDWSLPKGKLKNHEHPLAAAVREVAEETGVRAVPQLPLPPAEYRVALRPKVVDYWVMAAAESGAFQPNAEVDRVEWVPESEAEALVSYPRDAALLRRWRTLPPVTATVLLVRHADAGERANWTGPDEARPLSPRGHADAETLCRLLALFAPDRLVSAAPLRCRQTLAPLASVRDLPVEVDRAFDETTADPAGAAARIPTLAKGTAVVCSQGKVVPPLLAKLVAADTETASGADRSPDRFATAKGDGWLLPFSFSDPTPLAAVRLKILS
jgi:8-oxo-dGTP pyrophosphatase MutT (NUDIX family)/phosphohistidine phosphatase SixA